MGSYLLTSVKNSVRTKLIVIDDAKILSRLKFQSRCEDFSIFFNKKSIILDEKKYCKTFALSTDDGLILGFFTLSSIGINIRLVERKQFIDIPTFAYIPSILIGKLSTHKEYENKKIGTQLLQIALGKIRSLQKEMGIRLLIVNSLPESQSWWERQEFKLIIGTLNEGITNKFLYFDLKNNG